VTSVSALVAWQLGRLLAGRRRAGTVGLATLVGTELGQTLLLGGRDPLVLAMSLGSAAVLATAIQLPGISRFLGCTPLGPVAWSVVLACSAGGTLASAVLPQLIQRRHAEQSEAGAHAFGDRAPAPVLWADSGVRRDPSPEAAAGRSTP
jgi:cation-transporting P-type ATPase I